MPYQLTNILSQCNKKDASFFVEIINSYLNFTDDKVLKSLNEAWNEDKEKMPITLAKIIETEIRYLASNDAAYAIRKLKGEEPAGVEVDEMISDACNKLSIKKNIIGTIDSKLITFSMAVSEKKFLELNRDCQIDILTKFDISNNKIESILKHIDNKQELINALIDVLGDKAVYIIQKILDLTIFCFCDKTIANKFFINASSSFKWISALVASFIPVFSLWSAIFVLGPAERKTIPLLLYLGKICLRGGAIKDFWSEQK